MKLKYYIVLHFWSGEQTEYSVGAYNPPTEEQLIEALDLDFEPDKGETIEWFETPETDAIIENF